MATASEYVAPPDPDFETAMQIGANAFEQDEPEVIAFDTETHGFNWHDPAFCATVAWHGPDGIECHYFETSERHDCSDLLREMFKVPKVLVGHNLKFDLHRGIAGGWIDRSRLTPEGIEDTEALAHLDDEHRVKALKDLAVLLLGVEDYVEVEVKTGKNAGTIKKVPREKYEIEQAKLWAKKEYGLKSVKDVGYHLLPRGTVYPYALKDAEFTLRLYDLLKPRVEQYEDLSSLYRQEMELSLVFLDLEAKGLGCRPDYVDEQIKHFTNSVLQIERRIGAITGKELVSAVLPRGTAKEEAGKFNPNSNDQIKEFLTAAGHPVPNTEAETLATVDHPLAQEIVALRHDLKLRNTYFMAIKEGQRDGVFHPSIRQHGTVTGRSSSGKAKGD